MYYYVKYEKIIPIIITLAIPDTYLFKLMWNSVMIKEIKLIKGVRYV